MATHVSLVPSDPILTGQCLLKEAHALVSLTSSPKVSSILVSTEKAPSENLKLTHTPTTQTTNITAT